MSIQRIQCAGLCFLLAGAVGATVAEAQVRSAGRRALATHVVVPQSRAFPIAGRESVRLTGVEVGVVVVEQVATTTMDVSLQNPGSRATEAELVLPVPPRAVVRGFSFQGAGSEPSAQLLPKDEARQIYNSIVSETRDPALLEFSGSNLIRSSVFPVPARGTQKVRITYEHVLPADAGRVDYVLPRSELLEYRVPWNVSVRIKSKRPISTVYSPSHKLETTRTAPGIVSARIAADATTAPGPFRLSYLLEEDGVTASFFAYPDPQSGGGWFLMLAGLPARPGESTGIRREVTLVIDRSGSMHGRKIAQAREAALQILAGLNDGEAFNILTYSDSVERFSGGPVVKDEMTLDSARRYIEAIQPRGGTNIHDAILESLVQEPTGDMLPLVLFLTDGLPTVGRTSEVEIREVALKSNRHDRRVFTFGVGADVNVPLLERIATETRGRATFVLPNEDVEARVGGIFRQLDGPVLAEPKLAVVSPDGKPAPNRVADVLPAKLPDLFEGDQLVLLGRYRGDEPLTFVLDGNFLGSRRSFRFSFDVENATTKNAFVPRLWASRKIAVLVDAIRQLGANVSSHTAGAEPADPRVKELTDEILRLTTEHGILTEYTAFLAREGTDLTRRDDILAEATQNFHTRGVQTRSGMGAVNQAVNAGFQKSQSIANARNGFVDERMERVSISTVQQIVDRAYFRQGGNWIDGRLVEKADTLEPKQTIEFGSKEFFGLLERLTKEGRQGSIALRGDILLLVDDRPVLVKGPETK